MDAQCCSRLPSGRVYAERRSLKVRQIPNPASADDTIPIRRDPRLDDTQPVPHVELAPANLGRPHRVSGAPSPPSSPSQGRHRSACGCYPILLVALGLFLVATAISAIGGYRAWVWTATLPRRNILVLGLDRRPGQSVVTRSDTMILATIDPAGQRIGLLSIPRDLYVDIPGYYTSRINTAHVLGEREVEGGGPALAMRTVTHSFAVPIHYYVRVDFSGFRHIVDSVGGVDVQVAEAIVDHAYPTDDYGSIQVEIPAGPQRMDGETALRYARSRHGSSDFDRAGRQQQVLIAVIRRLLDPTVWPRLPRTYAVLMENIDTDLTFVDLILLSATLVRVGPDNIQHFVIGREMTQPWTTPSGGAVLLPRWDPIRLLVQQLFLS